MPKGNPHIGLNPDYIPRMKKLVQLAKLPMVDERENKRVEIIILRFKEEKKVIDECVSRIVNNTQWPYKLNIYDNRCNTANTSKIWNKLIRDATCDYVCMIDSDAFVPSSIEPCWLTRMMESIDECGIVYPVGDNVGGINGGFSQAEPYPSSIRMPDDIDATTVRAADRVASGYCYLVKKSVMQKVGWFDEQFYLYGQDSEWSWRCNQKGGAIIRTDTFVRHLGSYSAKKDDQTGMIDRMPDREFARRLFLKKTGIKSLHAK